MTIITKSAVSEKKPCDEDALVSNENLPVVDEDKLDLEAHTATVVPVSRRHQLKNSVTLCLLFTALLILIIGTLGGIHFYQQLAKQRVYHSSINLPIDETVHEGEDLEKSSYALRRKSAEMKHPSPFFHEDFRIDLDTQEYERITVTQIPKVFQIRPAHFVHQFTVNKTGIVDIHAKRCYILPLDRIKIYSPRVLFEVMVKLKANYYTVDSKIYREKLRVVYPPLRDLQALGYHVARECVGYSTFRLERMTRPVFKRSIDQSKTMNFMEFAGNLIEYSVIDYGSA